MPRPIPEDHPLDVCSSADPRKHTGDAETLIRHKMRVHMTRVHDTVLRELGLLPKAAWRLGRYSTVASPFWRQLFSHTKA